MFFDILVKESSSSDNVLNYHKNLITSIMVILNYLRKNGKCIFKVNLIIYNKISEFIYFLSYLFENINIVQLESSDNMSLFIQCNDFIINENRAENYNKNIIMFFFLLNKFKTSKTCQFISLFQTKVPYFFQTKLNNIKNIVLQQKIEVIYNLKNYFYSHHKSNICESNLFLQKVKHINNQKIKKTISWCKKYNINHH